MKHTREDCKFSHFFKYLYHFHLLFYRSAVLFFPIKKKKLLTEVNAVNIPWNTRQYINTSHISSMYSMYFFFQIIVSNTDCKSYYMLFVWEWKKYNMLYDLKHHHLVADIFHWMWIPSWMFKGGSLCFRLLIYNPWILVPCKCLIQLEC